MNAESQQASKAFFGNELMDHPQQGSLLQFGVSGDAYRISKELNPSILYLKRVK